MTIADPNIKAPITMDMLYPQSWLAEKAVDDAAGRTNGEIQTEVSICML
jgi:hypothetical protein